MYYFMFVLGFIFLIWYNFNFYHTYGISRKRALWYSLTFMYGMLGANMMGRIYTAICVAKNIDDYSKLAIFGAVMFAPLLILMTVGVERLVRRFLPEDKKAAKRKYKSVSARDTLDMLTPGLFATIALGKIGCMIEGCCFGIECSWGVHSEKIDATVLPVQIFESITLFLILAGCYYLKRTKFYRRGMAYPITAILYCSARFGFEFLRYYTPELRHLVFGITLWQCLCMLVIAVCAVALIILSRNESNPLPPLAFIEYKKEPKKKKNTDKNSTAKKSGRKKK